MGISLRKLIASVCFIAAAVVPFSVSFSSENGAIVFGSPALANTGGGPIVLDGMDPVCHAAYGENTDQYIAKVLKSVYDQSTMPGNNGKIAILGVANQSAAGGCGGSWTTLLNDKFLVEFDSAPEFEFISTSTELTAFFDTGITSSAPRMLWIPDDWSRSGAVNSLFTTNAEKIADFVNSGGGLFSSYNSYGWLTALLPSAVFNNGGCNGGPEATTDGFNDFGLTNTIVEACWHGYFTGNVGTLKVLVDYPYPTPSDTRKAVSIGGGEVSLPSSFTLAISPTSPNAGEDLTITATAQTISGIPQSGVSVTITVSSGPDAGQTFTATTDSNGIAVIVVRTNSTGSATYTATAIVNGVSKTVSTTVSWNPPTTVVTTVPPTTEAPTTTSAPVVETTQPVVETTSPLVLQTPESSTTVSPTTTEHDHSTHSHEPKLPKTGANAQLVYIFALLLLVSGTALIITSKEQK